MNKKDLLIFALVIIIFLLLLLLFITQYKRNPPNNDLGGTIIYGNTQQWHIKCSFFILYKPTCLHTNNIIEKNFLTSRFAIGIFL